MIWGIWRWIYKKGVDNITLKRIQLCSWAGTKPNTTNYIPKPARWAGCAEKRGGEKIMVMQNRFEREDDWAGIVPSYTHKEYVEYNRQTAELQKKVEADAAWMAALPQPPDKIAYLTRTVNSILVDANQSIIDWKRHDPRFVVLPQYQETRRDKPCPAWHIPFDQAEEVLPELYSALEGLKPSPALSSGKPRPVKRC